LIGHLLECGQAFELHFYPIGVDQSRTPHCDVNPPSTATAAPLK
jgi:hypothetical protein